MLKKVSIYYEKERVVLYSPATYYRCEFCFVKNGQKDYRSYEIDVPGETIYFRDKKNAVAYAKEVTFKQAQEIAKEFFSDEISKGYEYSIKMLSRPRAWQTSFDTDRKPGDPLVYENLGKEYKYWQMWKRKGLDVRNLPYIEGEIKVATEEVRPTLKVIKIED